ncbi:MAG TPA: hypothetical protein VIF40_10520 [Methylosinus sp.]|uniref:hypothetical protein n=1 Tax=Methylosinus sp. TaxID=427 RepID=UPI002F925BEE
MRSIAALTRTHRSGARRQIGVELVVESLEHDAIGVGRRIGRLQIDRLRVVLRVEDVSVATHIAAEEKHVERTGLLADERVIIDIAEAAELMAGPRSVDVRAVIGAKIDGAAIRPIAEQARGRASVDVDRRIGVRVVRIRA